MHRRNFLKSSILASTACMVPSFLSHTRPAGSLWSSRSGKVLVVIQLSGGNDGLNTVIPYEDAAYYQLRPTLGIPPGEVLKISELIGFHPALAPLEKLYREGFLSIVNNVGYPNPDRSHFRSMDIWHTASDSSAYWTTGWLGRYLDHACAGKPVYHALEVDDGLSLALKGEHSHGFAMSSAQRIQRAAGHRFLQAIDTHPPSGDHNVAYLYKTLRETRQSAEYLYQQSKVHKSSVAYPDSKFATDLRQIAELMTADTDTRIYYVSLGGFDTHAGQLNRQARLLKEYAEGVAAFAEDLQSNGLWEDTLVMTFSEFGRRARQNAGGGTDHGTANNVFLMGGQLRQPGFYNPGPVLSNLPDDDLVFDIDFRSIYAAILNRWLEADAAQILQGRFELVACI